MSAHVERLARDMYRKWLVEDAPAWVPRRIWIELAPVAQESWRRRARRAVRSQETSE